MGAAEEQSASLFGPSRAASVPVPWSATHRSSTGPSHGTVRRESVALAVGALGRNDVDVDHSAARSFH